VPQNRERIFLVGFLDHEVYHRFSFAPKQKLHKRLKDVLESDVDEKYYLSNKFIEGSLIHKERHEERGNGFAFEPKNGDDICGCLATKYGNRQTDTFIDVIGLLDCKGTDQIRRVYGVDGVAVTLTTMQGGNQEPKILQLGRGFNNVGEHEICPTLTKCSFEQNNFVQEPKIWDDQGRVKKQENPILLDHCPTLRAQSHGNEPKVVQIASLNGAHEANSRVYSIYGLSPTLMAGNNGGGQSPVKHMTIQNRIRKLTPRECLRLQDFPDTFKQVVSDSQMYKQVGNSMSVNVLEMIFRQIENTKEKPSDTLF
jgi:DNA (cytosine-5)-methyltransferase 1